MALQINQKKYDRQQIGQQRWKQSEELGISWKAGWGTWWWETGVGKTFATVDMIRKMITHNSSFSFKIVVPTANTSEIFKQWKNSIESIIPVEYHQNIEVITIHKVMDDYKAGLTRSCTLLILDEVHEYYSDERIKICQGEIISTRWCLALTANFEDINNKYRIVKQFLPVVDRIDSDEALREGYISKYIEYNLGVYLTPLEREQYAILTKKVTENLSKFGGSLEMANKVLKQIGSTPKDYSLVFAIANSNGWKKGDNPDHLWAPGKIMGYASNAMNAIRERKNIIYTSVSKLKVALEVIVKFNKLKTICFSQSTLYADTLASQIKEYYKAQEELRVCVAYHSKLATIVEVNEVTGKQKKKGQTVLKREAIEAITKSKNGIISTASSLDRGADIEDMELTLTTSGTQNPTQHNQRRGRSVRVKEDKDRIALIINIYARNTIDEKWLRTRQSKSQNVVYYVDDVNDINYSPKKSETFNINEI